MPSPASWGDDVKTDTGASAAQTKAAAKAAAAQDVDDKPLPARQITNENGTKRITEYERNADGKIVKRVRVFRTETRLVRTNPAVEQRRKFTKFGLSKGLPAGPDATTCAIGEEVFLVLSAKKEEEKVETTEDIKTKLQKTKVVCRKCKGEHWTSKCPYRDDLSVIPGNGRQDDAEGGDDDESAGPASGAADRGSGVKDGVYRAPTRGAGASMQQNQDFATIRVTNLSESTREDDLRELFRPFGPISRCFLATDAAGNARGFAFISFHRKEDAQLAIDGVSGHGYDHLILHVEWAKPAAH